MTAPVAPDSLDMLGLTMGLPEQVEAAAAALAGGVAGLPDPAGVGAVLVLGMGGSGIAGDVAAAVAGPVCPVPIVAGKDYELPGFVGDDTLVVAVSCSGNTVETVEAVTQAVQAGAHVVAVSQGGTLARLAADWSAPWIPVPAGIVMPRAAIGALVVPVLAVLGQLGLLPGVAEAVAATVEQLRARRDEARGGAGAAAAIAGRIGPHLPLVYGGGPLGAVAAARWKAQCNENAKRPAWSNRVPELCHNEAAGWGHLDGIGPGGVAVVELRHDFEHPDVEARFALVREVMAGVASEVVEVRAAGDGSLAQLFDLVLVGDLVSLELAARAGVDPGPIDALDTIKAGLAR